MNFWKLFGLIPIIGRGICTIAIILIASGCTPLEWWNPGNTSNYPYYYGNNGNGWNNNQWDDESPWERERRWERERQESIRNEAIDAANNTPPEPSSNDNSWINSHNSNNHRPSAPQADKYESRPSRVDSDWVASRPNNSNSSEKPSIQKESFGDWKRMGR